MKKIDLKYGKVLQGSIEIRPLNFLFVFQVNCPGCFLYGIPVVNKLYHKYRDHVSFVGLSTTFEDFELNTEDHTRKLLEDGLVIGETAKALAQKGYDRYQEKIHFPIAMDLVEPDFMTETNIAAIAENIFGFDTMTDLQIKDLKTRISRYLSSLTHISYTFTINQMKGTPTIVIYNDKFEVLDHWFGHKHEAEIIQILNRYL